MSVVSNTKTISELAGARVLVAEDAWHVARALAALFEEFGLVVIGPTATVEDARRLLRESAPDLAVVDMNLKGKLAYGLLQELDARQVPFIVVTGYATLPRLGETACVVVQKPFTAATLLSAMHRLAARVQLR